MAIEPHHNNKALQELLDKLNEQSGNSNHEALSGLLGGNAAGHYHMTAEQLQQLNNLLTGGHNHEALSGLLGGDASGHHHLTLDELNKLKGYPNFSNLNHENLQGLLGGNSSGRYHLTADLLNKLINLPANGGGGSGSVSISVGSVTTGAAGSNASVTNSGTSTNAIFNFVIPRGDKGDSASGGDVKYRIVRKIYTSDSLPGSQLSIPEGVTSVCISGCGGGAGLRYSKALYERSDKAEVYSGFCGEQCIGFIRTVKPHDTLTVSVGSGGQSNFISAGRNIADGKDSIVYLNGAEILKLRGGYAGDTDGSNCYGYNSGSEFIPPTMKDDSAIGLLLNQWLYGEGDNELVSRICSLFSIMNPIPTLFPPYGMASYNVMQNGGSGLIIIEYIEQVR